MLESRLYAEKLMEIVHTNLAHEDLKNSVFFKVDNRKPTLYLLITSNLGLCGSYNYNILSHFLKQVKPQDLIYSIGEKAGRFLRSINRTFDATYVQAGSLSEATLTPLIDAIVTSFKNREVSQVIVVYTKFINSLVFQPLSLTLLPLSIQDFSTSTQVLKPPLIEPDPLSVFEKLVPFYLKNALYASLIESQVSEQSSRRNAMEKASDNADELVDQLQLEFNKQRQANITQEIAEIIGGSST
jgi:F-type H+-transporting ATPase subunit gamma